MPQKTTFGCGTYGATQAMFYDDMKLATVCACPEASWTGLLFRQGQLLPVTGLELSGRSYKVVCSWSLNACAGPGGVW